jgi:hypothetical protein
MNMRSLLTGVLVVCVIVALVDCSGVGSQTPATGKRKVVSTDVCVYGATASGIMAAIAVKKEGRKVVIVEPGKWVGGILGSGIKPIQDCPNFPAVGGNTRIVMQRLGMKSPAGESGQELRDVMRNTSPADIRNDFLALLRENDIEVIYDHRVVRTVKKEQRITQALFDYAPFDDHGLPPELATASESLEVVAGVFIDASYEGELMSRAGVSFMSGRESEKEYQEDNAGVRQPTNLTPIDPYVVAGDKKSGLLPLINTDHKRPIGAGDFYTQAYNFRFYLTADTATREVITRPDNYRSSDFELVGRYVEHLVQTIPNKDELTTALKGIFPGWMNAGEYNYQRNSLITMAPVGVSHTYINGDYATKARVWKYHQDYLRGLHEFMSTDQRVPENFRLEVASLGLDRRHHRDTHGWPHQLYIRVSRRLVGMYTIHAADVYNKTTIDDPVGLAQYGIDTYPSRRIVVEDGGKTYVALEGKMFIGGAQGPTNVPYPIPYRAIVPAKAECTNLLVPVCFSATHLGYASARMEPVFMICGESAGIAAVQALVQNTSVQDIDPLVFHNKLVAAGQRLEWPLVNK